MVKILLSIFFLLFDLLKWSERSENPENDPFENDLVFIDWAEFGNATQKTQD
jgi:hypothetical protein